VSVLAKAVSLLRVWLTRLQALRETYPELELVSAEAYRTASYTTVGGEPIAKPDLGDGTLYVALRPEAMRYLPDPGQLVLLELPIDPNQPVSGDTRALILDPETGQIRHRSANDIGYRVGFYGNAEDPIKEPYVGSDWRREAGDTIYGPLKQVPLEVSIFARGLTDEDGRYHLQYFLPPCPVRCLVQQRAPAQRAEVRHPGTTPSRRGCRLAGAARGTLPSRPSRQPVALVRTRPRLDGPRFGLAQSGVLLPTLIRVSPALLGSTVPPVERRLG
jgi:hypothetical protein